GARDRRSHRAPPPADLRRAPAGPAPRGPVGVAPHARGRVPRVDRPGERGRVSTLALTWHQFRFERRLFWRNPSALFFNFSLPVIFLVLIASVFSLSRNDLKTLVPGIAGMAVMATTFNALAFNLTFIREQGIIKRMRGTPLPSIAYFGGVLGNAVMNAVIQVTIIVVLGHVLYGVSWPQNWLALVVFTFLG